MTFLQYIPRVYCISTHFIKGTQQRRMGFSKQPRIALIWTALTGHDPSIDVYMAP